MNEFMDIDGPEFIADVNNQIASFRATSVQTIHTEDAYTRYINSIKMPQEIPIESFNEIAVLDTNFLLSKLGYLDTLLELANENPGNLLLILPWIAVKELDGLKEGNREVNLSARKAMRFLQVKLGDKSLSLKGQKMNEFFDKGIERGSVKNDDRILDCCMYFQHISKKPISLLSNDRNLCIKAMVHGIESVSAESTKKMEAVLNKAGGRGSNISAKYSDTNKSSQRNPILHSKTSTQPAEDYGMDIDDYHPKMNVHSVAAEEDFNMMIDDDFVCENKNPVPLNVLEGGSEKSKWAKIPSSSSSSSTYSRHRNQEPAYLDNDPTLTAPRRPFRPEHISYAWAVS